MNELFADAKAVIIALLGTIATLTSALASVLTWVNLRLHKRVEDHLKDHDLNYVRRDHLDKTLEKMNTDRRDRHQENVLTLARIEKKIDENEERASKTRHGTRGDIGSLTTQVAVLSTLLKNKQEP